MTALNSVLAKISRLTAIVRGAQVQVDKGQTIDLTNLEQDADVVVRELTQLPKAQAQTLAPNLEELLSLLDDMENRLETRRAEYERRLADLDGNIAGSR